MAKITRKLRNVTKYSKIATKLELEDFVENELELGSRKLNKGMTYLLNYEGVGEIKLSGKFLKAVPDAVNLPASSLIQVLDMSKSTFYRTIDKPLLDMETIDKLSSLFKLYQKGIEAFEGKEEFVDWLNTKIATLGRNRPVDLIETETGRSCSFGSYRPGRIYYLRLMLVYKIEKKKHIKTYPPEGSKFAEGRWSTKDMWVVYTSESIALAKLETLANSGSAIPDNRYLIIMEVMDSAPLVEITAEELPDNWQFSPYHPGLAKIIKGIMRLEKYVGVIVPSAQSFREKNILLFPDFEEFDSYVKKLEVDHEYFDKRLK